MTRLPSACFGLLCCLLPSLAGAGKATAVEPCPQAAPPVLTLSTERGTIAVELAPAAAPAAVQRLVVLASTPWEERPGPLAETNYFAGLAFDQIRARREIRLELRHELADERVPLQISARSLGLHERIIEEPAQAMEVMQREVIDVWTAVKGDRSRATPTLVRWMESWRATHEPRFLLGISRQQLYEAFGFQYEEELPSLPVTRGSVLLRPASPTTADLRLVFNLVRREDMDGKWMVVGRVLEGLELVERLSLEPLESVGSKKRRPESPVHIETARIVCPVEP